MSKEMPIGYWIKAADRALTDTAFEPLCREGLTRHHWQVLNVAAGALGLDHRVPSKALEVFADTVDVGEVVRELAERGWVEVRREEVDLTTAGAEAHRRLSRTVGEIRDALMAGIEAEQYDQVVQTLQRIVGNAGRSGVVRAGSQSDRVVRGIPATS